MKEIDDFCQLQSEKNSAGTLTIGEAMIGGYYRLRSGEYAGRVVIKCHDRIDDKAIVRFANGLTWCWIDGIKNILCERVIPTFSRSIHPIDYSQSTWYPDGSNTPMHHEW